MGVVSNVVTALTIRFEIASVIAARIVKVGIVTADAGSARLVVRLNF